MSTKVAKKNKFIDDTITKHFRNQGNLLYIEGVFGYIGRKPSKKIYLEMIDEFVKNRKYKDAIEAGSKAGREGASRLIYHGYKLCLTDKRNFLDAVDFFESARHIDGLILCAEMLIEAGFLNHGKKLLKRAAKLKIK